MMRRRSTLCFLSAALLGTGIARGQTVSPVQSTATIGDLTTFSPVYLAGSDAGASSFLTDALPEFQTFVDQNLGEQTRLGDSSLLSVDVSRLTLSEQADVRVYFIGEGAGYHNTLGAEITGSDASVNTGLIFPDATSSSSYLGGGEGQRSGSAPLLAGDFVDLGTVSAGSQLDFFLLANGAFGGQNRYSTDVTQNPDGIEHVVSYALAAADSPYLLIGFEDLFGGGDQDYNDLVVAIDIGQRNVQVLSGAEPSTILLVLVLMTLTLVIGGKPLELAPCEVA